MTLIVAGAFPEFAFLATDTREVVIRWPPGGDPSAGQVVRVTDGGSKLYRLACSWWAGWVPPLSESDAEQKHFSPRANVWGIFPGRDGFHARRFNPLTGESQDLAGRPEAACPDGQDPAAMGGLLRAYDIELAQLRPVNGGPGFTLPAAARQIARLFIVVRRGLGEDGAVGPAIEFGILRRDDRGHVQQLHLPPTPAEAVCRFTGEEFEAALHSCAAEGQEAIYIANQGSMLPFSSPAAGTFFSYAAGGVATGQMWISFGWTSQTIYRPDQTTFSIPAPPAAPSAPSLSAVSAGALGARTLYARVAYCKTDPVSGIRTLYPVSGESSLALNANEVLKVTSPSNPGGGLYDGWAVLVGSATNQEYVQGISTFPISFGTDWTEDTAGFSTTDNAKWTSSWKSLTKVGLADNTAFYHYPYYDIAKNQVLIPTHTSRDPQLAVKQNGDGAIGLGAYTGGYSGMVQVSTPLAGQPGSGSVGGGRLL